METLRRDSAPLEVAEPEGDATCGNEWVGTGGGDMWLRSRRARSVLLGLVLLVLVAAAIGGVTFLGESRPDRDATDSELLRDDASPRLRGSHSEGPGPRPAAARATAPERNPPVRVAPLRVRGAVVDARWHPVAAASVLLEAPDSEIRRVVTDPGGCFVIALDPPPRLPAAVTLLARWGAAAAETSRALPRGAEGDIDVGILPLGSAASLRVRVVDAGGAAVPAAEVWLGLRSAEAGFAGVEDFRGPWNGGQVRATAGDDGVARFPIVPVGDGLVVARAPGPLRGAQEIRLHVAEAAEVTVTLDSARDLAVRVLDEVSLEPISGVRVTALQVLPGSRRASVLDGPNGEVVTDDAGVGWIRAAPHAVPLLVRVVGDDWRVPDHGSGILVPPGAEEVTVRVPPGRDLRWPILPGTCPVPLPGTPVSIVASWRHRRFASSIDAPAGEARIEGGDLVVDGVRQEAGWWIARTADGRVAHVARSPDGTLPPVRFHDPRRVVARVHTEAGVPLQGVGIRVVSASGRSLGPTVLTDTGGLAVLDGLVPERVRIACLPNAALLPKHRGFLRTAAHVEERDLGAGDAELDFVLPAPRSAVVRILVDGRAGFPEGGMHFGVLLRPDALRPVVPPGAVFDADRGEVRFHVQPPQGRQSIEAHLSAARACPVFARLEDGGTNEPLQAVLRVEHGVPVRLRWNPEAENVHPPYLERRDGRTWTWYPTDTPTPGERSAGSQVVHLSDGTYRLHSGSTEVVGGATDIAAGDAVRVIVLLPTRKTR